MARASTEEQAALQDTVHRLLASRCTEADLRRTMATEAGVDPALWSELAAMGVVGLVIDPIYGGVGGGPVELELIMEEVGAALLCSPLLSAVLAAGLIQALDDDGAKSRLLPGIADGSRIATVALTGPTGNWTEIDIAVMAAHADNRWTVSGTAGFVTHGQLAHTILVIAKASDGLGVFEVEAGADGLAVNALPTFDHTLRLAQLSFDRTPARRLAIAGPAWDAVERALDLARVALAGEQAGGARRVLAMTVEYAKTRIQFGRPIGSFQAIKHMAADLALESESALSAARHAAQALADGAPESGAAISLAAFACADAFTRIAADAIQMHGGIAFTWAHPAHLYLRRARADAQLLGTPSAHRERFLTQLGA